jgi:hypothetical protein
MEALRAEGISTFLISSDEYNDLTGRARLADLLADKIIALEERLAESEALRGKETAEIRKRLAKLENPHKPKDTRLLDELYLIMQARGLKQVDFATAARMVKRSKARMLQLKGEIGEDMRFMLVPMKNKIVIRVR